MQVSTNVTPSLHPNNVKSLKGYNESTSPYLAPVVTIFDEIYQSVDAIYSARVKANRNGAWTEASKVLQLAQLGEKYQNRLLPRIDNVVGNLAKAITAIDGELSKPLEQQAGAGTVNGEIRAYAKSLEHKDRTRLLHQAIQDGDNKTAGAILGAPPYLSGLSAIQHEMYLRQFHEHRQPELANRLAAMSGAKALLEERAPMIFGQIEKAVGASFDKVKRLREANSEAEAAFILKDFDLAVF